MSGRIAILVVDGYAPVTRETTADAIRFPWIELCLREVSPTFGRLGLRGVGLGQLRSARTPLGDGGVRPGPDLARPSGHRLAAYRTRRHWTG